MHVVITYLEAIVVALQASCIAKEVNPQRFAADLVLACVHQFRNCEILASLNVIFHTTLHESNSKFIFSECLSIQSHSSFATQHSTTVLRVKGRINYTGAVAHLISD